MPSSNIGNPAGYFGDFIRRGLSMRQGIREFRAAGGRMGNEAFRSTWRSVQDSLIQHPTVSSLPGAAVPGQQHYSAWQAGREGRFGHQVNLHVFDQQIGGVIQRDWMVMSDRPMTPDEATQFALDEFNDAIEDNPVYGRQRATAATLTGLYRTV